MSELRVTAWSGSGQNPLPNCRELTYMVGKEQESSLGSLLKWHQSHSWGLYPYSLITIQGPPPNTITLRGRISTYVWGGGHKDSTITPSLINPNISFIFKCYLTFQVHNPE